MQYIFKIASRMALTLNSFCGEALLSDVTLVVRADKDKEIKAHKVVLASASAFFHRLFSTEDHTLIARFEVPVPIATSSPAIEDVVPLILRFIYSTQKYETIKGELNPDNIMQAYSYAYMLEIESLKKAIEGHLVASVITSANCT